MGKYGMQRVQFNNDAALKLLTWDDADGKNTFWHSSAHLLAEAVEMQFPGAKFWVGPALEKGFYYDIDLGWKIIKEEDVVLLEQKMNELAKKANDYIRKEMSKAEAVAYFTEKGDEYKLDLLSGLEDGTITFYTQGALQIYVVDHIFQIQVRLRPSKSPILLVLFGKGMKKIKC